MIRAFHGLPSGVKCTNLIGSVINLLAQDFCCSNNNNKDKNYIAGGDDFVVGCKKVFNDLLVVLKNFQRRCSYDSVFSFVRKDFYALE